MYPVWRVLALVRQQPSNFRRSVMVFQLFLMFLIIVVVKTQHETTEYEDLLSTEEPDQFFECPHSTEAEQIVLDHIFNEKYKKGAVPKKGENIAQVEMHINDITELSELKSEFALDLMYSEMWTDHRLSYDQLKIGRCIPNITLDLDYLTKIWTPNICIVNSKAADIHSSPNPNVFLILYADGSVWKNCRMVVRAPCQIDLRTFPFDTQTCNMMFESYSYNIQKVRLKWYADAALTFVKKMELPDFTLSTWRTEHTVVEYPNGFWDQLKITFVFKRRVGFFILQAYVPTFMTIFVAWINFWMDPNEQLATRATLGISAFLAITLQFGNILKNQPPVSYVKAMDVWMLGCLILLFGALAELAVVSYILRRDRPILSKSLSKERNSLTRSHSSPHHLLHNSIANSVLFEKKIRIAYLCDKFCLLVYPPLFLCFNIFYWVYYNSSS